MYKKCIECKPVETVNGYVICREVDQKFDIITGEPKGHKTVFYTVNDDEYMLESCKTLAAARKYAREN